jgi:hypothetical protein
MILLFSAGYFMKLNYLLEKYSLDYNIIETNEFYEDLDDFNVNKEYFNSHEIILLEIFNK